MDSLAIRLVRTNLFSSEATYLRLVTKLFAFSLIKETNSSNYCKERCFELIEAINSTNFLHFFIASPISEYLDSSCENLSSRISFDMAEPIDSNTLTFNSGSISSENVSIAFLYLLLRLEGSFPLTLSFSLNSSITFLIYTSEMIPRPSKLLNCLLIWEIVSFAYLSSAFNLEFSSPFSISTKIFSNCLKW